MKWFEAKSFVKDVAKLSIGTIVGRGVIFAAMPLLTRLYTPEDFSLLAIYLSLVTTIAIAACLRLDVAIPVADNDDDAAALVALSLLSASLLSCILFIPAVFFKHEVADILGNPQISAYLWLVPIAILLVSSYSVMQFWATRLRRFGIIARTRITQSVSGVVVMIASGSFGFSPIGLLTGHTINMGAGGGLLAIKLSKDQKDRFFNLTFSKLKIALFNYSRFPKYSTLESFSNVAGMQLPILIIAAHAKSEAGQLFLALQVMMAPMILIGSSISQVYVSRAQEELKSGRLAGFTANIIRRLFFIGAPLLLLVGFIAPQVFHFVFGAEWKRSGEIVALSVPWMLLQFMASPISMVMFVVKKNAQLLALTLFGLLLRLGGVYLALVTFNENLTEAYVFVSAFYYFVCLVVFSKAAGISYFGKFIYWLKIK